ncbi:hypothetical protein H8E77_28480 [bacterium]|nr:hypothetical protein [bacterium]
MKNILFPSQMHRGYPDFYMGIPAKSKDAYIDFLEYFVEQQLPFKDLAKEIISEAAYSILKEMDVSVGGLLDPSGKPTELGQKVLEYIEQMDSQTLSTDAEDYDISKTIVHGQETVHGTGEETSYQTSIQRTTWEEHSETEIHLFTTAEEWSTATTIHPEHAANFDFTIVIENIGTDTAIVIEYIRFNIYISDNPFTPEYENFPPITYPPINEPGFSLGNFYPGREGEFGVSVPLTLDQLRAIDEGAKVQLYTAYYSYGEDELIFNNAWHADVMFEIDDGVSDDDETIDRFLIPVIGEETYIDAFNRAHIRAKDTEDRDHDGDTEEYRVISIEVNNGMIIAIDGLPVSESGSLEPPYTWWNVYLTESNDAAYFINTTAQPGNRVLFLYSQDSDGDGYSDREEFRLGTDRYDADSHPDPVLIAAKHYEQSGDDVTATIKLQNIGNYEAYCAEARLFALDDSVSIDNAVIGGDGHIRPGEVVMPTSDTFKFHINYYPYTDPVMMVRYTDPQGLHTFISTILLTDLGEDISSRADEMFRDAKFDADTIGQYVYSASNPVFLKYYNPLESAIKNAMLSVVQQSIFGDVFQEDSRTVDILPGYNLFIFSFIPEAYVTDTGIGKDIVVLAAIEDYQGVLIDSDVQAVMIVSNNPSPYSAYLEMTDLADGALDFGTSLQGQPLSKSFTVFNTGLSDIEVLGGLPNRDFAMTPIPRKIQPGDSSKVEIDVNTPAFSGDWSDEITIATSDPTQPNVTIPVTGTTEPPAEIVSVYEITNSPWQKLIYISGDHSAGEVLEFDHPITLDLETEPLYVYQDDQPIGQGKIISPDDYIISKTMSGDRIQLILPQDVVNGLSLEIEFGKAMEVVKEGE